MIKKLEKAGLGYYVKDDNTQQKFGKSCFNTVYVIAMQKHIGFVCLKPKSHKPEG